MRAGLAVRKLGCVLCLRLKVCVFNVFFLFLSFLFGLHVGLWFASTAGRLVGVHYFRGPLFTRLSTSLPNIKPYEAGDIAQHCCQRTLDRMTIAMPFMLCQALLLIGTVLNNTRSSCYSYFYFTQAGYSGLLLLVCLSFFAFTPWTRWLMRSPPILQFQMLFTHRQAL